MRTRVDASSHRPHSSTLANAQFHKMESNQPLSENKTSGNRGPKSELSRDVRAAIYAAKMEGVSAREIAARFGVHRNTVTKTVQHFEKHSTFDTLPRTGRPEKLTAADKRYLRRTARKNPHLAPAKLTQEYAVAVSATTVRRALSKDGVHKTPTAGVLRDKTSGEVNSQSVTPDQPSEAKWKKHRVTPRT